MGNILKPYLIQEINNILEKYKYIIRKLKELDYNRIEFTIEIEVDDGDIITDIFDIKIDDKEYESIYTMDDEDPILKLIEKISELYTNDFINPMTLEFIKEDYKHESEILLPALN